MDIDDVDRDAPGTVGYLPACGEGTYAAAIHTGTRGRLGRAFLDGLFGAERRKTGWMRADAAGDPGPWRQQAVLGRGRWDADTLRDVVRDYARETLADTDATLVLDETDFLKQGKASCGVHRQYTGSAGKIVFRRATLALTHKAGAGGRRLGKLVAPERRRQAVAGIREKYRLTERHAGRIVGQHRGTQRYVPTVPADEDALTRAIIALASEYGRYGHRRVTALLQAAGWQVGKDRVQRIWRREGLKVPQKHRPRSRLWLNDGSCVRRRPLHRNHVWSFDFVQAQTHDGRFLRMLTLIDEHSRACRALRVARRINGVGVIEALADAMCLHGIPEHIRCDNGPEMISKALRKWVAKAGSEIQYIAPGSPWENGYCERFNGKLRDECLRQEIFYPLKEA